MLDKGPVALKRKGALTFLQTMEFQQTGFSIRFGVLHGLRKAKLDY